MQISVLIVLLSLVVSVAVLAGNRQTGSDSSSSGHKLVPPADNKPIPVAFVLTEGATVIDFAGPWEVFQDAGGPDGVDHFQLFTVGSSKQPIRASGGLTITPDYSFDDAPTARIIVIPAQRGDPKLADWLRQRDKEAEVVMSVCTGAFPSTRSFVTSKNFPV